MAKQADIHKAGGVFIKDRHLLVTRAFGKDVFVAPGGKLEPGESSTDALLRELDEELQVNIDPSNLELLGAFHAIAAGHENMTLKMDVYLIKNFQGELLPNNEIEEIMWINTQTTGVPIGSIFEHDVMPMLKNMDLID